MAKLIRETIVVFQHTVDTERYPRINELSEDELKKFLDDMVYEMFELDTKEEQLNKNGTHSGIRIVRD